MNFFVIGFPSKFNVINAQLGSRRAFAKAFVPLAPMLFSLKSKLISPLDGRTSAKASASLSPMLRLDKSRLFPFLNS